MSQWTEPAEHTRQKDVGPGDKTGVYYITLCNLPFGTSWQELKDFTRTVCDVDHVEVFRTSTSGWVRVNGRQNFDKAWKLLNGGQFNGRCIIASDRNTSDSIKIKELVDISPELSECVSSSPVEYGTHVSQTQFTPTFCRQQFYTASYPHVDPVSYEGHGVPEYTIPSSVAFVGANPVANNTGNHYERGYSSSQAVGTFGHYWGAPFPYQGVNGWSNTDSWDTASLPSDSGDYVQTERRKVLVRELPFRARPEQVTAWVRKKMGPCASKIRTIEVPCGNSDCEIRGHAYVSFRSSSSAREAVKLLDQSTFKGRQVSARMAIEGVTLIEHGDADLIKVPDAEKDKKTRRAKHKETTGSSSLSASGKRSSSQKDPKSGKNAKNEKHGRDSGPLVVDGTGKRRPLS